VTDQTPPTTSPSAQSAPNDSTFNDAKANDSQPSHDPAPQAVPQPAPQGAVPAAAGHHAASHTANAYAAPAQGAPATAHTPAAQPRSTPSLLTRGALDTGRWSPRPQSPSRRSWWFAEDIPAINRCFLACGTLLLGIGGVKLAGPPVVANVAQAVRPYTAAGKQEACLSHLRALAQAVSLYAQDNDSRYPPLDYQVKGAGRPNGGGRTTWVSLLGQETAHDKFTCAYKPIAADQAATISSYGFNPVLPQVKASQVPGVSETLLLADRGDQHDVSLLPPFPSWPQAAPGADSKDGAAKDGVAPANIDFRHGGSANLLYADGHARAQTPGSWTQEVGSWGGGLVLQAALERMENQHPLLRQVSTAFEHGNSAAAQQLLARNRKPLRALTDEVALLWRQNRGTPHNDEIEKLGWRLAGLWQGAGEKSMEQALEKEQSRRTQVELAAVQQATWQPYSSDWGFGVEYPANWTVTTEVDGRYQNTYFRSASPFITVLVEKGTRTKPATLAPIQWTGEEKDYQRRYGAAYRRIELSQSYLGGEEASRWEFESKKPDGPPLRKLYVGRSHIWDSYVIACTAPADNFEQWQPTFDRLIQNFQFR